MDEARTLIIQAVNRFKLGDADVLVATGFNAS